MIWGVGVTVRWPYWAEAALVYFFSAVVLVLAGDQRRAIISNLKVVVPDLSIAEGIVGVFRVFVNFGWATIDGMRARVGQDVITWEIDGMETFERLRGTDGAALIMTTHTGNYDLAGALFSPKFGRDLHTVRMPEKSPYLQEIRRKELEADSDRYEHFKVHYNSSESLLGVELARLLSGGELVAIQCDRVIGEVAGLEVPIAGKEEKFRTPRGPMTLATMARCPCYPLHVVWERHRHYRIIFPDPLEVVAAKPGARVREGDFARAWVASLMPFLEEHVHQWFVFEEAFTK